MQRQLNVGSPGNSTLYFRPPVLHKKCQKTQIVFLHFHARKLMITLFNLKWTELTRNSEFVPIIVPHALKLNLEQSQSFLCDWSISGKIMAIYVF